MQEVIRSVRSQAATGHVWRQEPGVGGEPEVAEAEGENQNVRLHDDSRPSQEHVGPDALSRNLVCGEGLMGNMDAKEARLCVLAGIRITEDKVLEADEMDAAAVMAEDKLNCYVCPILLNIVYIN